MTSHPVRRRHWLVTNFLRPATSFGERFADLIRILGLGSLVVVAIGWGFVEMAVFSLALLGVVAPRFLGARALLDAASGIVVLVAAWSAVLDLYNSIPWWDIVVHFALNGLVAALAWVLCLRLGVSLAGMSERRSYALTIVLTTALGLATGALWEMGEWLGHTYIDDTIYVAYNDTIGDLVAGGLGSILAGCFMPLLVGTDRSR
ncbi:hypothetical protein [Mycetocola zhadangensis]|uniref:DUF2238 domain-containing protein n=1 Tax=Mycetocola zhadangensis TaxID=1164595 RepID=A0A3L7J1M5_9MICO|nr:hypothetical protein [Mycetocola zhadangensis]RLQ84354.1 hypothetical protein D9V28_09155 [Mycetocola zhadangensis]GGE93752.1 hypothetical protein GCM10011313_15920 [Mycetocola zhadangensis]